jgi:hypothetical protein
MAFPTVNYRYLFEQKHPSDNALDFSTDVLYPLWQQGVHDAIDVLLPEKPDLDAEKKQGVFQFTN